MHASSRVSAVLAFSHSLKFLVSPATLKSEQASIVFCEHYTVTLIIILCGFAVIVCVYPLIKRIMKCNFPLLGLLCVCVCSMLCNHSNDISYTWNVVSCVFSG